MPDSQPVPPAEEESAADKLAANDANGIRTGKGAAKPKPADAPAKPKGKPGPDRATLLKAAKLRDGGAGWNEIREATGTKLGSSA